MDYSIDGTVLTLGAGALTLDLAEIQRDYEVSVDIFEDENGNLTPSPARRYVAELRVPAREYAVIQTSKADDFGFPVLVSEAAPLDCGKATLTLWRLAEEEGRYGEV